eukprot:2444951-Amphidinium_carterae.1
MFSTNVFGVFVPNAKRCCPLVAAFRTIESSSGGPFGVAGLAMLLLARSMARESCVRSASSHSCDMRTR